MERHTQKIRAALSEELSVIQGLIALAEEMRNALVSRDSNAVLSIETRQQTMLMRLDIVRGSLLRLGSDMLSEIGTDHEFRGSGLRALLRFAGDDEGLRLADEISATTEKLTEQNTINNRLLAKQLASMSAFRQLIDIVTGVEQVYDRQGGTTNLGSAGRIEQQG